MHRRLLFHSMIFFACFGALFSRSLLIHATQARTGKGRLIREVDAQSKEPKLEQIHVEANVDRRLEGPFASAKPNHDQVAFDDFRSKYGKDAKVLWNPETNLPLALYGFQKSLPGRFTQSAAFSFIQELRHLLLNNESPDNLRGIRTDEYAGTSHAHFQQYYKNVRVHGAVISVHSRAGHVSAINGKYIPGVELDTQPKINAEETLQKVRKAFDQRSLGSVGGTAPPELVIYNAPEKPVLCWRFLISTPSNFGEWEVFVNAQDGTIEAIRSLLVYIDGTGYVYDDNPFVTPNVVSRPFKYLDGSGFLSGLYANVVSYQGGNYAPLPEAYSVNHQYFFPANDRRFDEQNVYYHINQVHDYFRNTFGFVGRDQPIPAAVHALFLVSGKLTSNNAQFGELCQCLSFGDGSPTLGIYDLAKDGEVIYHEYTHAVINKIVNLGSADFSFAGAMNEAYADYFACSNFGNPYIGESAVNQATGLRNLENNKRYPQDVDYEVHDTSLIYSGALWDLWKMLGRSVTDQIVFASLYELPQTGDPSFQEGLAALIEADKAKFGGSHLNAIRQAFSAHGIYEPANDSTVTNINPGQTASGSIPARTPGYAGILDNTQYAIDVPAGSTSLEITLSGTGNVELFVRAGSPVTINQGQPEYDFASPSTSSTEVVTINLSTTPPLKAGTYYAAVGNVSDFEVSYSLQARLTSGGASGGVNETALSSGQTINDQIAAAPLAEENRGLLGEKQYFIDVPFGTTLLEVKLIGTTTNSDIDLLVRRGSRIEIDSDGYPVVDAYSMTKGSQEVVYLDQSTTPKLVPGARYYIGIANWTSLATDFKLTATSFSANLAPIEVPLRSAQSLTDTLVGDTQYEMITTTNYTINVPWGTSNLDVDLQSSNGKNVDIFLRTGTFVFIEDGKVIDDYETTSLASHQTLNVSMESNPPLSQSKYYITVGNRSTSSITFNVKATTTQGGGPPQDIQVSSGSSISQSIERSAAGGLVLDGKQYVIDVPSGTGTLKVSYQANPGSFLVLVGRYGRRVDLLDPNGADFFSYDFGESGILGLPSSDFPSLSAGKYYIALLNLKDTPSNYTLKFELTTTPPPPTGSWDDRLRERSAQSSRWVTLMDHYRRVISGRVRIR